MTQELAHFLGDRNLRHHEVAAIGAALAAMKGHADGFCGAKVLSDGRVLSWCGGYRSRDTTWRLWDGDGGAALAVMVGHDGPVDGAEFLPDGRMLSWSGDQTLRLWDGQTGAALDVIRQRWLLNAGVQTNWITHASNFVRVKRVGNLWGHSEGNSVAHDQWRALWHGESPLRAALTDTRAFCTSGMQVIFLQLMRGSLPAEAAPTV